MEFDSDFSNNSTNNPILDQFNPAVAELGPAQPQLVPFSKAFLNTLLYFQSKKLYNTNQTMEIHFV